MTDELRPPEGTEDALMHWLDHNGQPVVAQYTSFPEWGVYGKWYSPAEAYERGLRYHAPARPDDATERARLEAENARLREALEKARDQFAFYAEHHNAKGATEKATSNQQFVDMCREALRHDPR